MENIKWSDDYNVFKIVHPDKSETCIKPVLSCQTDISESGVRLLEIDKNKYSLFISSSVGCPVSCKFCYLTITGMRFNPIPLEHIVANVQEAIKKASDNMDLSSKYVKICWMGMGDATLLGKDIYTVTSKLLKWIITNNYAVGVDGVDISTTYPAIKQTTIQNFTTACIKLNDWLNSSEFEFNPYHDYVSRSKVRLFYSLMSTKDNDRSKIMPYLSTILDATSHLQTLRIAGVNVLIHHILFDEFNDSENDLNDLVYWFNNFKRHVDIPTELRILRYNKHHNSKFTESRAFEQCICFLKQQIKEIKVQVSYGKQIRSACGQFIYNGE